ncbi:MAG TPA: hypothetical protein VN948_12425 [Terriglobales bacterium]|nr:hypothetical protein [Terriglobales bacterium]
MLLRGHTFTSLSKLNIYTGKKTTVTDRGALKDVPLRQSLEERLQVVPDLLARAVNRRYALPSKSLAIRKLRRTIELRDSIIHPRWDKYLPSISAMEAAQAVDAVELYLDSVWKQLHPYLIGYVAVLPTIRGFDKHDVAIGHRTAEKRVPKTSFTTMTKIGIVEVLVHEWVDMVTICSLAFEGGCEGDSAGSLLTRVALVLLFAGLNSQLSIVAQWRLHDRSSAFHEAERNFLNENAVGLGMDGEIEIEEDRQSFKERIVAVPTVLVRRVESQEINIDLGTKWGEQLQKSYLLRNAVVHAPSDKPIERVSLLELRAAATAVRSYFEELVRKAPETFKAQNKLLPGFEIPDEADLEALIKAERIRWDNLNSRF